MDLYVDGSLLQADMTYARAGINPMYGIEDAGIAAGTHTIKVVLKLSGTEVTSAEKSVNFVADAPRVVTTYTSPDNGIYVTPNLYATSELMSGKTVTNMELYDGSGVLAANIYNNNTVSSYSGNLTDKRYDGAFESEYFPYSTSTTRYHASMRWIKKKPAVGSYTLRVTYADGSTEDYANAVVVTEETYIDNLYFDSDKNNYEEYVYLSIDGVNLTNQQVIPVCSVGGVELETSVVDSIQYSSSNILVKLKKVNWPCNSMNVNVELQDTAGKLLAGAASKKQSMSGEGFYFLRYNYATNLIEAYCSDAIADGSELTVSFAKDNSGTDVVATGTGTVENGMMTVQPMAEGEAVNLVELLGSNTNMWLYMGYSLPGESTKRSKRFYFCPGNNLRTTTTSSSWSMKDYIKSSDTSSVYVGYTYRENTVGECTVKLYDNENQELISQDMQVTDYTDTYGYYSLRTTLNLTEELAEGTYRVEIVENGADAIATKELRVLGDDLEVLTYQNVSRQDDTVTLSLKSTLNTDSKVTVKVTDVYGKENTYDTTIDQVSGTGYAKVTLKDLKASDWEDCQYYFKVLINEKEPKGADFTTAYYADERGTLKCFFDTLSVSYTSRNTKDQLRRYNTLYIYDAEFPVTVNIYNPVDAELLKTITVNKIDTESNVTYRSYTFTASDFEGLNTDSGYYTFVAVSADGKVASSENVLLYGEGSSATTTVVPDGVTLDKTTAALKAGSTLKLSATISPSNANSGKNLTWSSSDEAVATVDADGTVTAHKAGNAVITVKTANDKSAACEVTVTEADKTDDKTKADYKITYVNAEDGQNGVTNANPTGFVVESDSRIELVNPNRPGYVFGGWFSKSSMKEEDAITFIDCSKRGDVKVYAKWTAQEVTLRFDSNAPEGLSASGTMKELKVTYGKTKTLTKNAYKVAGYSLVGWSTVKNPGEGDVIYQDKAAIPAELVSSGAEVVTLYAQWELTGYTITYVNAVTGKAGVTVNDNPASFHMEQADIELTDPVRPGYVFGGWYSKASMKETQKIEKIEISNLKKAVNVKVYAKWTAKTATIQYEKNLPADVDANLQVTGTMKELKVTYGKTKTLTANKYKLAGYTFTGWNTAADGSGETYTNKAVIPAAFVEGANTTITLYAQWELTRYNITYVNAVTDKAGVTKNDNPVSFNMKQSDIELTDPVRPGYVFGGWYSKASMKETQKIGKIEISNMKKAANVKVYAKWTGKTATIQYEKNLPVNAASNLQVTGTMKELKVTYGKTKTLTANKYKLAGYTFAGWNTAADGSGEAYTNKAVIPAAFVEGANTTITLYAQWKPIEYKITYVNAVNGKNGVVNDNPTSYTLEKSVVAAESSGAENEMVLTTPSKEGYTFAGWYTDKKLTKPFTTYETSKKKKLTLYAKWTANN